MYMTLGGLSKGDFTMKDSTAPACVECAISPSNPHEYDDAKGIECKCSSKHFVCFDCYTRKADINYWRLRLHGKTQETILIKSDKVIGWENYGVPPQYQDLRKEFHYRASTKTDDRRWSAGVNTQPNSNYSTPQPPNSMSRYKNVPSKQFEYIQPDVQTQMNPTNYNKLGR
jgi:hypothetical protein